LFLFQWFAVINEQIFEGGASISRPIVPYFYMVIGITSFRGTKLPSIYIVVFARGSVTRKMINSQKIIKQKPRKVASFSGIPCA